MRDYLGLNDVAELVETRYAKFLTGLIVNQFQTELVRIAFNELFTVVVSVCVCRGARRRTHGAHMRPVNLDHSFIFLLNFEFSRFSAQLQSLLASTFCNN